VRLAQWARVRTPGRTGLRAGAWYSVVALTARDVHLVVRGRAVTISRALVELRDTPPHEWTVVRLPGGSDPYLVCPGCRHRTPLPERHVNTTRCPRCNGAFAIAWGHAVGAPRVQELEPDRRLTRRRKSDVSRNGEPERRATPERRHRATSW